MSDLVCVKSGRIIKDAANYSSNHCSLCHKELLEQCNAYNSRNGYNVDMDKLHNEEE